MGRNSLARDDHPTPKTWGRRPYADKSARELMNDVSATIARTQPDGIDPTNPALSDVIRAGWDADEKATTLRELMGHDMTFQEAVCWYWYAVAQFSFSEIHFAMTGIDKGGDASVRRDNVRNIHRVLTSAAHKHPDADPVDIPALADVTP